MAGGNYIILAYALWGLVGLFVAYVVWITAQVIRERITLDPPFWPDSLDDPRPAQLLNVGESAVGSEIRSGGVGSRAATDRLRRTVTGNVRTHCADGTTP